MILFKLSLVIWSIIIVAELWQCFILKSMTWKEFDKHLNEKYFT